MVHNQTTKSDCGCGPKQIGALGDAPAPECKKASPVVFVPLLLFAIVGATMLGAGFMNLSEQGEFLPVLPSWKFRRY